MAFRSPTRRLVAAVLAAAMLGSGCSVIGMTMGAVFDATAKPTTIPGWDVKGLEPGMLVTLGLDDGTDVAGTYEGRESDGYFIVRTDPATLKRVDVQHVAWIRMPPRRGQAGKGFLVGLGIDLVVAAAV